MPREDWEIARQALASRSTGMSESEQRKQRQLWENVSDDDRRFLKRFGAALWAVSLAIVLWENVAGPGLF